MPVGCKTNARTTGQRVVNPPPANRSGVLL
jgi:hypothetical protein